MYSPVSHGHLCGITSNAAAIRQNYNEIAEQCRKTAEPVFLTKNGEGDLVVMDIGTYNRREKKRFWECIPL